MIRKTLIGIATAIAMMAAAATSANAHSIAIGFGYGGPGWGGGYGPGYGWGGGGYGLTPGYDACRPVVVGYRMKRVWFHGMPKFVQVPVWRTRCF